MLNCEACSWKGVFQAKTSVVVQVIYEIGSPVLRQVCYEGIPMARCYGWLNPCVAVCYVLHNLGFPDEHHFSPLKAIRGKGVRWNGDVPLNCWVASLKDKRIDL